MGLTKAHLKDNFKKARETNATFVFIVIVAEKTEEIITVPKRSFDAKEAFYDRAYNDNLVHCMNSQVYIRGISYGEAEQLNNIA